MKEVRLLAISLPSLRAVNRDIYRQLAKKGVRVQIVAPQKIRMAGFESVADPPGKDDPPIHFLTYVGENPRLSRFKGIWKLIRTARPDIIFLESDVGSFLAIQVGFFQWICGGKLVCLSCDNVHRSFQSELRNGLKAITRSVILALFLSVSRLLVSHVFCISSDIASVMDKRGFQNRRSTIPLGYSPEIFYVSDEFRKNTRRTLGIDDNEKVIAYFGRIVPSKGIDVLLDALDLLQDLEWRLLIDDFSQYSDPYATAVHERLNSDRLRGKVVRFDASHEEMPLYMNCADIVVLTSVTIGLAKEQYGRVIPEAMACGCVPVVSNCGALPEIVGSAGFIVPERDTVQLAAKLKNLLLNTKLRDLGATASVKAMENLTTVRASELIINTISDC